MRASTSRTTTASSGRSRRRSAPTLGTERDRQRADGLSRRTITADDERLARAHRLAHPPVARNESAQQHVTLEVAADHLAYTGEGLGGLVAIGRLVHQHPHIAARRVA